MTPREKNRDEIAKVAFWHGVSVDEVISRNRKPHLVAARRDCAVYLHNRGKSFLQIGRILERERTTVINLVWGKEWKTMGHRDPGLPINAPVAK